jgi:hypothetical protein
VSGKLERLVRLGVGLLASWWPTASPATWLARASWALLAGYAFIKSALLLRSRMHDGYAIRASFPIDCGNLCGSRCIQGVNTLTTSGVASAPG